LLRLCRRSYREEGKPRSSAAQMATWIAPEGRRDGSDPDCRCTVGTQPRMAVIFWSKVKAALDALKKPKKVKPEDRRKIEKSLAARVPPPTKQQLKQS
jgi:hypothetical protein